ncbi:hypothetical protein EIP86_003666, partial [Pleurotus ostreatoroseus]
MERYLFAMTNSSGIKSQCRTGPGLSAFFDNTFFESMQYYIRPPSHAYRLPTTASPYQRFEDMHIPALLPTPENAEFMPDQIIVLNPTPGRATGSDIPAGCLQGESTKP